MFGFSLFVLLGHFSLLSELCFCFNIPLLSTPIAVKGAARTGSKSQVPELRVKDVVAKVAVTGATGRTGKLVVQELLDQGVQDVVAIVRDPKKAKEVFSNPPNNLQIVQCDLCNEKQLTKALNGCDAAIWCATGFGDNSMVDKIEQFKRLFNMAMSTLSKTSIDVVAIPIIAKYLLQVSENVDRKVNGKQVIKPKLPKLVMCSSGGVTRPGWSAEKKAKYPGAADIPIVRLNPFNILQTKLESENRLRNTGIDYCIVRPVGLNDKWPSGSRPLFTQGDVAVGRNNRKDVAKILVEVLATPESTGKTFEMLSIAGYSPAMSIGTALSRLKTDEEAPIVSELVVEANYAILQQLLPGERQDSVAIAMGQTYEQLDKGEVGRFGARGKEKLPDVFQPTS